MFSLFTASIRNRSTARKHKAFTLIELIVTVTVLALLAALAIPTFGQVRAHSRGNVAENTIAAVARNAVAQAGLGGASVTAAHLGAATAETNSISGSPLTFVIDEGNDSVAQRATAELVSGRITGEGWALALGFDGGCAMSMITGDATVSSWYVLGSGVCSGSVATQGPGGSLPDAGSVSAPSVVRDVTADPVNSTTVGIGFRAPLSNGGAPITGYRVSIISGGVVVDQRTFTPSQLENSAGRYTTNIGNLSGSTSYRFAVEAANSSGYSTATDPTESLVTPAVLDAPAAPGNLSVAPGGTSATLTWDVVAPVTNKPVDGYRIYRLSSVTGLYELIGSTASTSFTDNGLTSGVTYSYRVTAYGDGGEGAFTATVEVTPYVVPATPTNLVAAGGAKLVDLEWSAVSSTPAAPRSGYNVYQLNDANGVYELVGSTTSTSYTVSGLADGTTYSFRVAAYGTAGEGGRASSSATTATAAIAPNIERLGIINFIGTQGETTSFTSPYTAGDLDVTQSSTLTAGTGASLTVDQTVSDFHSGGDAGGWARYDFGSGSSVKLTGYSIQQRTGASNNLLRGWDIEGSNNGSTWSTLHSGATTVGVGVWHDHTITNPSTTGYRYLRLRMTDASSTGETYLTYSSIEFYGSLLLAPRTPRVAMSLAGSGYELLSITSTWGARPTSYKVFRDGTQVATVTAASSGATTWTDTTQPVGLTYYSASAVSPDSESAASVATSVPGTTMPVPTSHAGNVSIGSKSYFIGGYSGSAAYATLRSYDRATGTWATLAPLPVALWAPLAAASADGSKIYVVTGYPGGGESGLLNSYEYDVASNTWSTYSGTGTSLFNMNAGARVGNDIYLFGGFAGGDYNQTYKHNTTTRTWTRLADMPGARQGTWSVASSDGSAIYVGGGWGGGTYYSTVWKYTLATNSWSTLASQPYAGGNSGATLIPGNRIVIVGGHDNTTTVTMNNIAVYDMATDTWSQPYGSLPRGTGYAHVSAYDGRVWIFGGYQISSPRVTDKIWSFRY